jgi:hypothetical protein
MAVKKAPAKKAPVKKTVAAKKAAPAKKAAAKATPKVAVKLDKPKKTEALTLKDVADMLLYMEALCMFLRSAIKNLDPKMPIPLKRAQIDSLKGIAMHDLGWTGSNCPPNRRQ